MAKVFRSAILDKSENFKAEALATKKTWSRLQKKDEATQPQYLYP